LGICKQRRHPNVGFEEEKCRYKLSRERYDEVYEFLKKCGTYKNMTNSRGCHSMDNRMTAS